MVHAVRIADILGGQAVLQMPIATMQDLQKAIARGLPIASIDQTALYVTGDPRRANRLKDRLVPRATRSRRRRLKPDESERVERIARVMATAEQVWENREAAREFLMTPHPMLENETPLEMAGSELGARRVEDLLMGIEYSLPV